MAVGALASPRVRGQGGGNPVLTSRPWKVVKLSDGVVEDGEGFVGGR